MPDQGRNLVYESGQWQVHLGQRELRARGVPVPIGARAVEILGVLVESANELVTKGDLMDRVWPGAAVGENTLQVHISAIRGALGRDRTMLKTASRRGYCLRGQWTVRQPAAPAESVDPAPEPVAVEPIQNSLPMPLTDLIGRDATMRHLRDVMSAYRVVTLTGPGGIGKTRLALEIARGLLPGFDGAVRLLELASLSDPGLVSSSVAAVLGLNPRSDEISPEAVARAIGDMKLLLVLDNCEHVIGEAATLAEILVHFCPRVTILATSREGLRIQGELMYRVPPLEVPAEDQEDADKILGLGAPKLFIARLRASGSDFMADARSLKTVAAVCRRLDGIPLAIEFAAARAVALGIEQVEVGLSDRLALLTSGRRTAVPRHRTLRAALDWSYELLPEIERLLLRRLAVFAGGFSLEAVVAVTSRTDITAAAVFDGLANLVAKSLVAFEGSPKPDRWWLLETIRVYALQKLAESGEREPLARRHADYYRGLFERAQGEWDSRPTAEMRADYGRQIDNVRAAIDWAFSPAGNAVLGAELTIAAVPLWMHLSLLQECRVRVERAIAALAAAANQDPRLEMKLHAALGASLAWIGGSISESEAAWVKALHLAESLGDVDHQLRSLWGLWLRKKSREALPLARQFLAAASTAADRLVGDRMIAVSSHYLGDQDTAWHHIEHVVANDAADDSGPRTLNFQIDQRLGARTFLARILWVRGFPDQAIHVAKSLVEDARAAGHANSLCHSLAFAGCPIPLWAGDLELAEHHTHLLRDSSARHALSLWRAFGKVYQGVLFIKRGDVAGGLPLIRGGFDAFGAEFASYRKDFVGEFAEALGRTGQAPEGLARVEEEVDRSERSGEYWIMAELLRVKGELLAVNGTTQAADEAGSCFRQALDWAERQNALSWELRAAMSLARLLRDQERSADSIACLQPIHDRFTEGFETADLKSAKALLVTLKQTKASRCPDN